MAVLFIVNPVAGKGRTLKLLPTIEKICKENDVEYVIKYTREHRDGIRLAREAAQDGYDRIISVGGDGTLNEVVNGMAGTNAVLGVIPGGTGNDFIRTICDGMQMDKVIETAISGNIKDVDLAKCGQTYFINIGSGGFDAKVALESEKTRKFFPGSMAYLTALLKTLAVYKGSRMHVDIDGQTFDMDMLLVAVANGRYYGGGILPTPKADLADGVFDICFVQTMPRMKMFALFPKYMKGTHEGIKEVHFYKGKSVKMHAEEEFCLNIDGEVVTTKSADFIIIPSGIKVATA